LRVTVLLETVYSVKKKSYYTLQFHKILLGLYTVTNSYYTFCVTKHGILV